MWSFIERLDSWFIRIAVLLGIVSALFFARAAFAQPPTAGDLQRQILRLEDRLDKLEAINAEATRIRQIGFERLATVEAQVNLMSNQIGRMENFIYGTLVGLLANLAASIKALGDLHTLRKGNRA